MDRRPRRPAVRRLRSAGSSLLLFARPQRRACRTLPRGLDRHHAGGRLLRLRPAVQDWPEARPDHRGGVLGPWPPRLLRARRAAEGADRHRGGEADRCTVRDRARDQWCLGRAASGRPQRAIPPADPRPRSLAARPVREAVGEVEDRQSHRLPAEALARLHPLPRRWQGLRLEQRRGTRVTWHRNEAFIVPLSFKCL